MLSLAVLVGALALVSSAPLNAPATVTAVGPYGTIIAKAPVGTATAGAGPGGYSLAGANPADMTVEATLNPQKTTGGINNGVIPQFTLDNANIGPSGAHFVGNGPLGTLVLGEDEGPNGVVASFAAIGTRTANPNLQGYIASGALTVGTGGAAGGLVATNAHSTILGGFTAGQNGGGEYFTIKGTPVPTPLPKRTAVPVA